MSKELFGAPVAAALQARAREGILSLASKGIIPTLAIFRVGENQADLAYERGARMRCEKLGIQVKSMEFPKNITEDEYMKALETVNDDSEIHGILILRPLPRHLPEEILCEKISVRKDIDGATTASLGGVFANKAIGYCPCTAQAVLEILKYYGIPLQGRRAAVIGRSLVIGRPAAMLLLHENATVTLVHSRSEGIEEIVKQADIVIAATGQMESIGKNCLRNGQTVIDVGITWNPAKNKLCGDVNMDEIKDSEIRITPVPGGVGTVTTSVLALHVVEAAQRQMEKA